MVSIIALVVVCVIMGSFGQVYMKRGLNNVGGLKLSELLSARLLSVVTERNILTGMVLYAGAMFLWFVVLSMGDLSFVYPMIALGYVSTAFLARYYFGDTVTALRWFGILLILGGVFLIARS